MSQEDFWQRILADVVFSKYFLVETAPGSLDGEDGIGDAPEDDDGNATGKNDMQTSKVVGNDYCPLCPGGGLG